MPFPRSLPLLLACSAAVAADGVYQAPSPEPTAEETLMLRFINRCRADPPAEGLRLAPPGAEPVLRASEPVDLAMFRAEMAKIPPAPPLVFDLRLLESARKHAHYMILHGLGHDEAPGQSGFTGASPSDRMHAVGWSGGGGENAYRDAPDPAGCHLGFVIDWGKGGPGGMQPGRGHRANICNPTYTKVGVGAVANGSGLSVVHNLGGDGRRYAGGAAFVDRNGNGDFDPGEGRGGVEAESGPATSASWASGAYTVEIPATACTLVLRASGQEFRRQIPAGTANVAIDWPIPQARELAAADKLIAAAEKSGDPASAGGRKARVALVVGALNLALDEARSAKVRDLCGDLGERILADRARVRAGLSGDDKTFKVLIAESGKAWKGTAAADWFGEAELVHRARTAVDGLAASQATPTMARNLGKELKAQAAKADAPEFRSALNALADRATAAADPGYGARR